MLGMRTDECGEAVSVEFELDTIAPLDAYFGFTRDPFLTIHLTSTGKKNWTKMDNFGGTTGEDRTLCGVFFLSGFYRVVAATFHVKLGVYTRETGAQQGSELYCRIGKEDWRNRDGWNTPPPDTDWVFLWGKAADEHVFYTMPLAEYSAAGWKDLVISGGDLLYVNAWGHTAFWMNMLDDDPDQGEICKWVAGEAGVAKNRPTLDVTAEPSTCRAKHGHACGPVRAYVGQIAPA